MMDLLEINRDIEGFLLNSWNSWNVTKFSEFCGSGSHFGRQKAGPVNIPLSKKIDTSELLWTFWSDASQILVKFLMESKLKQELSQTMLFWYSFSFAVRKTIFSYVHRYLIIPVNVWIMHSNGYGWKYKSSNQSKNKPNEIKFPKGKILKIWNVKS